MTQPLLPGLPRILYGGDYNPEQWPEEVWREDVRLMREAGVNLVSLGIFSWSRLQPAPDRFEFDWLDRVIELLHGNQVAVDLATATASPPPWLSHLHPEMLPVLADGVRLWPGARQHYCPSSPVYRDAATALVTALADRYGRHPAVVMWHVNNEYGCHVPACYCDVSAAHFREWLERRYGSVDELNRAWGTDFWSQRYTSFAEVLPPRRTPTWPNPSQQLDFHRFCSTALLECYELERAVLQERSPGVPVTTNFMRFFKPLDYWEWAAREDIVSDDVYQDPADPATVVEAAMAADLMRSLGGGRPWILMEQTPGRVNWRPVNVAKAPGRMRLWSLQAVARGADGVLFFQWRQSRAGAEKFHSAMVPHGPPDSSPVWKEVVELGRELGELDEVCGSRIAADVAILHDWESWWALELPSKPSDRVAQLDLLTAYYRPLHAAGVATDFAHPAADLSRYGLVIAPALYLVGDESAANLVRYVEGGGHLVMTFFSGIVDQNDHIRLGGYPAPFAEMLGLRVEDWFPLTTGETVAVGEASAGARGEVWTEQVTPLGAEVVEKFASGRLAGHPAITRHRFGRGTAWYHATRLDAVSLAGALADPIRLAGVRPVLPGLPEGVEAVRRDGDAASFLFLLNHGHGEAVVEVDGEAIQLRAGDVRVLRKALVSA